MEATLRSRLGRGRAASLWSVVYKGCCIVEVLRRGGLVGKYVYAPRYSVYDVYTCMYISVVYTVYAVALYYTVHIRR